MILKLVCTHHLPLPGHEGRCLKCGHELDVRALLVAYQAANRDQVELRNDSGLWIRTPWHRPGVTKDSW